MEYYRLICAAISRYKMEKPIRLQYWEMKAGKENNDKPFGLMVLELKLNGKLTKKKANRLKVEYNRLSKVIHAR